MVSLTAYLPLSHAELERELRDLVDRVFDAMTCEPLPTDRVGDIGARLVELNCVGRASLQCTVDVLAGALLSEPEFRRFDRLPERVAHLIGALASGYADAVRSSTMEQQDNLHRALLEAMWVSERKLKTSESRLDQVLTQSVSGIAITDLDGRFIRLNGAFSQILDRSSAETVQATLFDLLRPRDSLDLREVYRDLLDGKRERLELRPELVRRNGETATLSLIASLLRDADGHASDYVTIIVDAAEPAAPRGQGVPHDEITGLPNRRHFTARLGHVLDTAKPTTLYVLELDGFSVLTDGLGRQLGDELLRAVAERLQAIVGDLDEAMVAHFDGGTFAILVESSPTAPDTVAMIKSLNGALTEPVEIADLRLPASASIGVAHQRSSDADPVDLMRAADLALRRAKSKGCGQWALFDPHHDARDQESLGLAATMPGAWDSGALRVVYRPVVRLADEQIVAIEGLLRWDHPSHGAISHQRCQELAEHTGLILPLGTRLLRRACEQVRNGLPLCVTLTPNQSADRDLVGRVLEVLEDTGVPPTRLRLAMPAPNLRPDNGLTGNLRALAAAGVQLALHHFRGAPEDLTHLEDFPIRVVHLAPSLIRRQTQHPTPESLFATAVPDLITLIHSAGVTVTVDDIHTKPQAHWWHQTGADTATGSLFSRPFLG